MIGHPTNFISFSLFRIDTVGLLTLWQMYIMWKMFKSSVYFLFQPYKSCKELKNCSRRATSGVYKIHPLPNAEPIEVYCELEIEGGGFTFLPRRLTLRSDAQQIVNALFKDKKNVLLKLEDKDRNESFTLIQPHPHFNGTDFGVLVNDYTGYTAPKNKNMSEYILFGILPASIARNNNTQGFRSNRHDIQFSNCDRNPNSLFAFLPNFDLQNTSNHALKSLYEESGVAVDWRSTRIPIPNPGQMMPSKFFFLTEVHFGGCGCYTSSNRWKKFAFNATSIGIR